MKSIFLSLLLIASFALVAFAQSNTGSLIGTVSDPSGLVAGATVVITDEQTGKTRTVVTNDEGSFALSQLDAGTYSVKITATGHKTKTYSAVKVDVAKTYSLLASVDVGDISEVVTVAAGADVINSSNAELSTTVTGRQIVELPLNGRNPLNLVLLQAGSSSNGAQSTNINGQRSSFTNITRDGINVQDNFIRSNAVDFIPDRPSVDDTGEFTIVTQNAGAEAGYGASQIQLVTPRGSNEFHGAGYLYNRNSKVSANSFFNNFSNIRKPFLNRNQFGGKLGGPIWKNHAFFFFNYEGFRQRQSITANRTILLPDARNGIFTYRDVSGVVRTGNIFTLANAAGIANVGTGINSVINSRIISRLPAVGNNAALGDQLNTTGLTLPITSNIDREAYSSRFDVDINSRNSFSAVINYRQELNQRTDLLAQQGGAACCYDTTPVGFQDANTPFITLSLRSAITNNLSNEVRVGRQKSDPIFGNTIPDPAYFIQVPLINNPETGFQGQGRRTVTSNLQDNAVLIKGNHAIRFGFQYDQFRASPFGPGAFGAPYIPTYVLGGGTGQTFTATTFNNASGCVAATGVNCITSVTTANSLLALLGGLIGSANQTFTAASQTGNLAAVPPGRSLNTDHYSFYGTDQWRISPTFTVNYGLRYELFTPLREPNGLALEPIISGDLRTSLLNPNGGYQFVGGNAGGNNNFFKLDKNNIAPVVSFAWSPNFKNGLISKLLPGEGKSVIRGGYRLSYVNDEFIRAGDNALAGNAGLTTGLTTGTINARFNALPTFTAPAGVTFPRTFADNNLLAANFGTVFAIDPNLQVPSSHEFSIGIQREIGFQTALEVRYVHSQTSNLVRGIDLNQIQLSSGFLNDFNRARNNIRLYGTAQVNCVVAVATPQCQPLTVLNTAPFNTSPFGNPLGFSNTTNPIIAGTPADLAFAYIATFRVASNQFLPNPNTGVVDLLQNGAISNYNSLQVELRRRFANGLTYQANYTFQKQLTDAPGTGQTRFEPAVDNARTRLEYGIGDQDTTHVFNLNAIYELPFGRGKRFVSGANGLLDRVIGGWQLTSIIRASTGAPISIVDTGGTFNRAGRSGRQTANSSLSKDEIRKLIGVFRTPCGVFIIDPNVINIDLAQCQNGLIRPRAGATAGAATLGFQPISGAAGSNLPQTFAGQVFFSNAPGQVGTLERNFLRGPLFFNWDASVIKNIRIKENVKFQLRGEAFNLLNRANFFSGQSLNIASTTFGRITSTFGQRIVQFVGRIEF